MYSLQIYLKDIKYSDMLLIVFPYKLSILGDFSAEGVWGNYCELASGGKKSGKVLRFALHRAAPHNTELSRPKVATGSW